MTSAVDQIGLGDRAPHGRGALMTKKARLIHRTAAEALRRFGLLLRKHFQQQYGGCLIQIQSRSFTSS
ncbi:hypothetical protein [Paraburkholderia strydomiana]|uniref:hypothetical protein n=1 Tax=Paraburkholderia strydomiana TaxID=1245417 RepID=UPI002866F0AB|nr:hypothetical protein [Paraburkholderia strydomiana]MDR7006202.1 hypothetical protein [Paraburkholderia strydomiana]